MSDENPSTGGSPVRGESIFVSASDGLRLHIKSYRPEGAVGLPAVCLPGLARTEADFELLAKYLSSDPIRPRNVFALDYRGRGQSAYDSDWRNYNLAVELADILTVLTSLGVSHAVFIGTSRGGLLTMLLGATQPRYIAGAVLNDIGPVIEPAGLQRIKGYIGRMPTPMDIAEGAVGLRRLFGEQFPALSDDDWVAWSERSWTQTADGLVARYDARLSHTLSGSDPDQPIPTLWEQFDALSSVPLMVIRGGLSDLLSSETLAAMKLRRPDMDVLVVPDQGHAPLLAEAPVLEQIGALCRRCDRRNPKLC